jgi:hypothetical protein
VLLNSIGVVRAEDEPFYRAAAVDGANERVGLPVFDLLSVGRVATAMACTYRSLMSRPSTCRRDGGWPW